MESIVTPFGFGKPVSKEHFTNRRDEIARLVMNFRSGNNTILISPRGWGKTSLVSYASLQATQKDPKLKFIFLDLLNIRTEEQFYQEYATSVLKSAAVKQNEIYDNARTLLGNFHPRVSYSAGPVHEVSIGLDWEEVKKNPDEILQLPAKIAEQKNIRFVICIDEFQNLSSFTEPLSLLQKLRTFWQKMNRVSFCFNGSKRNKMMEIFSATTGAFFKFGEIILLEKINRADWISFIVNRFEATGKEIAAEEAGLIADLTECHPFYTQQLSQLAWFRTSTTCDKKIIQEVCDGLVSQLSYIFHGMTDGLANTQVNFLQALQEGVQQFSSAAILKQYRLGTSANIVKIKKALLDKEIIDSENSRITLLDPIFGHWLRKEYFRIKTGALISPQT